MLDAVACSSAQIFSHTKGRRHRCSFLCVEGADQDVACWLFFTSPCILFPTKTSILLLTETTVGRPEGEAYTVIEGEILYIVYI